MNMTKLTPWILPLLAYAIIAIVCIRHHYSCVLEREMSKFTSGPSNDAKLWEKLSQLGLATANMQADQIAKLNAEKAELVEALYNLIGLASPHFSDEIQMAHLATCRALLAKHEGEK